MKFGSSLPRLPPGLPGFMQWAPEPREFRLAVESLGRGDFRSGCVTAARERADLFFGALCLRGGFSPAAGGVFGERRHGDHEPAGTERPRDTSST